MPQSSFCNIQSAKSARDKLLYRCGLVVSLLVAALLVFLILHPGWLETVLPFASLQHLENPEFSKIFLCSYLVLLFLARHYWISKPGKNHLYAQLNGLFLRIDSTPNPDPKLVDAIRAEVCEIQQEMEKHPYRQFYFGNTGIKIACWRRYHEIERLATALLPNAVLPQRLLVVAEDLSMFGAGSAQTLRDSIMKTLADPAASPETMHAQLVEAMKLIDDDRDNLYQYLADWQNKATYLIGLAVLMILFIMDQDNRLLFHFGMIGGLLAKLRGVINRNNFSIDYGVSWATLFLTPLVGGITGWSGLLLLHFANEMKWFNTEKLLEVDWSMAHTSSTALALALLFGYSATLFEKVLDKVQGEMEKKSKILKS